MPAQFNPFDAFVDLFRQGNRYGSRMTELQGLGIPTRNGPNPGVWWGSHADRLAQISASASYGQNPVAQARYLALLKQLGHLPRQAY